MMLTTGAKLVISLLFVGTFFTTDAQITGWTTPTITGADGAGTLTFPEDQAISATLTTFVATPTSTDTIASYTLSPATGTPFSLASGTGVLTLDSALDYETTPSYTLNITVTDSTSHSGTATITITVTDVDEAVPVFSAATYSPCIADKSPAGTTLTTVTATVKDTSDTFTYAISSGDTGHDFKITANSGLIQVNDAKTLDKAKTDSYALVVTAADNVKTTKTGTTTVTVTVADSCDKGDNGDKGDKGDNGDKGDKDDNGDKGHNGDSGTAVAAFSMMILIASLFMTLF